MSVIVDVHVVKEDRRVACRCSSVASGNQRHKAAYLPPPKRAIDPLTAAARNARGMLRVPTLDVHVSVCVS